MLKQFLVFLGVLALLQWWWRRGLVTKVIVLEVVIMIVLLVAAYRLIKFLIKELIECYHDYRATRNNSSP